VANGIVSFPSTANTPLPSATANIILLGQTIPVTQAAGVTVLQPILGGATMLGQRLFSVFLHQQSGRFLYGLIHHQCFVASIQTGTVVATPTNTAPNVFQFTTQPAINDPQRFYGIRSP